MNFHGFSHLLVDYYIQILSLCVQTMIDLSIFSLLQYYFFSQELFSSIRMLVGSDPIIISLLFIIRGLHSISVVFILFLYSLFYPTTRFWNCVLFK